MPAWQQTCPKRDHRSAVKFPWCLQGRVPGISDESDLTAKFKFLQDPSGLNGHCSPLTTGAEDADVGGKSPGRQDE